MAYIGTQPKDVRSFGKAQFDFTATASQTVFSGADDDGKTLGFTTGQIQLYVNGILMDASDYTTSNGNTVTLASAANANDIITVVALQTDIPNSDYVPATGGTFSGAVTHTGAFTSRGIDDNATSTAMTLDASGNLLVGKTSNAFGTTGVALNPDGSNNMTRASDPPLALNRLTSDGSILGFYKDGTTVGSIGSSGGYTKIISGNGTFGSGLIFNNVAINPVNAAGSVADATVKLGDTTSRFTDLYLSGGVYLGGTGAVNHLDDYEEGTWTPTVNTLGNISYASGYRSGYYTKIGRTVFVQLMVGWSSDDLTQDSTQFQITGLPFSSANLYAVWTHGAGGACATENLQAIASNANQTGVSHHLLINPNTANLCLAEKNSNGSIAGRSYMTVANRYLTAGRAGNYYVAGQFIYHTS